MGNHLSHEEQLAHLFGLADEQQSMATEQHLDTCAECRKEIESLRRREAQVWPDEKRSTAPATRPVGHWAESSGLLIGMFAGSFAMGLLVGGSQGPWPLVVGAVAVWLWLYFKLDRATRQWRESFPLTTGESADPRADLMVLEGMRLSVSGTLRELRKTLGLVLISILIIQLLGIAGIGMAYLFEPEITAQSLTDFNSVLFLATALAILIAGSLWCALRFRRLGNEVMNSMEKQARRLGQALR